MKRPANYPLDLYRGDYFAWKLVLWDDRERTQETDLTGCTVIAQIRNRPNGLELVEMTCTVTLPNIIDVVLDEEAWATWADETKGYWDLQITYPTGPVITAVAGPVTVTLDVSVPA